MSMLNKMSPAFEFKVSNFPTVIENDGSVKTLAEAKLWVEENREHLEAELKCTGALLFRGFPVIDAESYDAFFASFGYDNFTYKESLSNAVRINFTEFVFTANEGPKELPIHLHNEMAQTPIYPNRISLFCESPAEQGGATILCRSDMIYNELIQIEPELTNKLEEVGVKYTTTMPGGDCAESAQGRSWLSTLSVDNEQQAEVKLKELGYSWVWKENGDLLAQTAALPGIKTISDGRKVFFNQIIAAFEGWEGVKDNPSKALCFGDDTDIPKSFLEVISKISADLTFDLEWQGGDVVIVDNNLAMHGRRPFSGDKKRKVMVVLGK
ncbi:TauD/TfdA family dioxygenase [Vibrio kanaloae]|uniref:TauD/TfdA family dioxygenase n=1 Tax=Vibrio kanaloae TaxID=170673 RepID=UPI0019CFB88D|nr:TauD/TfdA family dioxygenase [Vibrio kanaloae]